MQGRRFRQKNFSPGKTRVYWLWTTNGLRETSKDAHWRGPSWVRYPCKECEYNSVAAATQMMTRDSFWPTPGLFDSWWTAIDCLGHSDRTWQLCSEMGIEWPGEGDTDGRDYFLSMYSKNKINKIISLQRAKVLKYYIWFYFKVGNVLY